MRIATVTIALALVVASARAEEVQIRYAPHVGQHSEVRMTKCIDANHTARSTPQCATFVYDEEIVSQSPSGYRIRYVATAVEGPGSSAALGILRTIPLDLLTDVNGAPTSIVNRQDLFAHLRQTLPQDDPNALAQTMRMYEQMDDATAAQSVAKDFGPLSEFQGMNGTIGVPRTAQVQLPFPLLPSQTLRGTVAFAFDGVDRAASSATAHIETTYDPDSIDQALQALRASVVAQGHPAEAGDMHFQLADRVDAVLDLRTGATTHARRVRAVDATQGAQVLHRQEVVELDRRVVAP